MTSLLTYIPGFKEPLSAKQPGKVLEALAENAEMGFQRMILPGDTRYDTHSEFSLSAVRERTEDLLDILPENTILVTYSLSTLPVFGAIVDKIDLVRAKVSKLVFLHPVDDPVYSISVMDWALSRGKREVKPIEDYLTGDPCVEFAGLIGDDWIGNAEQFQKDLREVNKDQIDLTAMLSSLDIDFSIIAGDHDAITRKGVMQKNDVKPIEAIRGHIPDLSNQRFIY